VTIKLQVDPGERTDDVGEVTESARSILETLTDGLPRVGIAAGIIVVGYVLSRVLRRVVRTGLQWDRYTPSFREVISKLAGWIFLFVAVLVSLAVTFPSIRPVNLLAGLGFFSVAIGFAFQDILENTLSGVLLLFRQPFRSGDEIAVAGYEGTVEGITIRETRIRQYDGQLLLVPNRDVYKNVIRVQTSKTERLLTFVVGVAYDADLQSVRRVVLDALRDVDTVAAEPPPEALVQQLGESAVEIGVRFWSNSHQLSAVRARDDAISAVKAALDAAGIDLPPAIVELRSSKNDGIEPRDIPQAVIRDPAPGR
jgi:small-conductance mechanosensitive channel